MNTLDAVKHLLLRFGAGWILWVLGGAGLASILVITERWLFLRRRGGGDLEGVARRLDRRLADDDFDGAIAELATSRAVAAAIAAAGLHLARRGPAAAEKAMQSAAALERGRLERGLAYLGTVGSNAPFVGLFGTVVGVIHAFDELGRGSGGLHAAGAASPAASQAVMGSVAEALVATAAGILVALPAVAAYNYFQRRVTALLRGTDVLSNLVLAYLADPSPGRARAGEGCPP